jgi:hypothetical protein
MDKGRREGGNPWRRISDKVIEHKDLHRIQLHEGVFFLYLYQPATGKKQGKWSMAIWCKTAEEARAKVNGK